MTRLYNHSWPGNVRELKNVIERASVLSDTDEIQVDSILISHEIPRQGSQGGYHENPDKAMQSLKDRVGSYEATILLDTLNATPSVRRAAKKLSISHTALLRKIDKYKLHTGNKKDHWNKKTPHF